MQVGNPVSLDDPGVIQQNGGGGVVAEEPDARTEDDGGKCDGKFVDQAGFDGLAGEVTCRQGYVPVSGECLRLRYGTGQPVGDEGERRVRMGPVSRRLVGDDEPRRLLLPDGRPSRW